MSENGGKCMSSDVSKGAVFTQIREFISKLKMEYNTEFNVILFTSFGKIVCDIDLPAKQGSLIGFSDDTSKFSVDISAIFDGKDMFEAHMINAKNVVVYKHDSDEELMRAEQMIIFVDQILGFTLSKK